MTGPNQTRVVVHLNQPLSTSLEIAYVSYHENVIRSCLAARSIISARASGSSLGGSLFTVARKSYLGIRGVCV